MDSKSAMRIISDLETKVRELTQERNNYAVMLINYQAFVGLIPRYSSDSPDKDITALNWIEWAKNKLGYKDETSKTM
jgi:hypothetical protein